MKAGMNINEAHRKCEERKIQRQKEEVDFLNTLLDFAEGKKKWNTGELWVCESHPRRPFEQDLLIDCDCGAPGMGPQVPKDILRRAEKNIIGKFKKMGQESLPPEEFEQLGNIIKILYSNRKHLKRKKIEGKPILTNIIHKTNSGVVYPGTCPVCASPLEHNGACSDVGSNNCQYQE